ncbi:MAG: DUF1573 domain-containing protein [Gemmataceae bacterium]
MKRAITLGILIVVAFAAQYATVPDPRLRGNNTPPAGECPIVIDDGGLHLGRVFERDRCQHSLLITNAGESPVTIVRVAATCDCTDIEPSAGFSLRAGEARHVSMSISLPDSKHVTTDSTAP